MAKYKTNKQICATLVSRALEGVFDGITEESLKTEFGFRRLSVRKVERIRTVGVAMKNKLQARLNKIAAGRKPRTVEASAATSV